MRNSLLAVFGLFFGIFSMIIISFIFFAGLVNYNDFPSMIVLFCFVLVTAGIVAKSLAEIKSGF